MAIKIPNRSDPRALPKLQEKGNQANAKARFAAAGKNEAAREANAADRQSTTPLAQSVFGNFSKLNVTDRLICPVFFDAPNIRLTCFFFDRFAIEYRRHFLPTPHT